MYLYDLLVVCIVSQHCMYAVPMKLVPPMSYVTILRSNPFRRTLHGYNTKVTRMTSQLMTSTEWRHAPRCDVWWSRGCRGRSGAPDFVRSRCCWWRWWRWATRMRWSGWGRPVRMTSRIMMSSVWRHEVCVGCLGYLMLSSRVFCFIFQAAVARACLHIM